MIENGDMINCGGWYENVKLQMGDYHLKTHKFAIDMGGCDVVLGVEWLRTLGPISMDFQELYINFTKEGDTHHLKGINSCSLEFISSHHIQFFIEESQY